MERNNFAALFFIVMIALAAFAFVHTYTTGEVQCWRDGNYACYTRTIYIHE